MVENKSAKEKAFDVFNYVFLTFITLISLYPFLYVIFASFSDSNLLLAKRGLLFYPLGFNIEAYKRVFNNVNILNGYKITLIVLFCGVALNILMTSFGAYVLSRKNFRFKKFMMIMIVITMYFGGGLIPRYLLLNNTYHLGNNLLVLILPCAINTMNLIIMRTNFISIPSSLEESARLDGANDFTILFKVILPLSKAVIAVMILYYGVAHWNSWFDAMVFLREKKLYPLQLTLRGILISESLDNMASNVSDVDKEAIGESIKHATIIVATVPILLVYPFIQKYFVKGVMIGALKG